jgi:hypothetical protein
MTITDDIARPSWVENKRRKLKKEPGDGKRLPASPEPF